MSHLKPFHIDNFKGYCDGLLRVGIDPGYVLYTNHHESNQRPATRLFAAEHLTIVEQHLANPSAESFKQLVAVGVLQDTSWDFQSTGWQIIAFSGWEVLHNAFGHLHHKAEQELEDSLGVADFSALR